MTEVFEITLRHRRDGKWPVVVEHIRTGELPRRSVGQLVFKNELDGKLAELALGSKDRDECLSEEVRRAFLELEHKLDAEDYGERLGQALFQGQVFGALQRAREAAELQSQPLRVLLVVEDPVLELLRWERLCAPNDSDGWDFLALDQRTLYARYIPSPSDRRFPAIGRRDLRALVLLADPPASNSEGLSPFDAANTAASIGRALGDIPHDVLAPLAGAAGPATLDALCERITAENYTLIHLVAHGGYAQDGKMVLYLLDRAGEVKPVTATELIKHLGRLRGTRVLPHFAFLAVCESAKPVAKMALGGLAQRFVRELGMPAVVAMTDRVSITTAERLAVAFYRQLRQHGEADRALVEACAGLQGRDDVIVPALFSRLGGRPLFSDELGKRELTDAEIRYGLVQLAALIPDRAPRLEDGFVKVAQALCGVLGTDDQGLGDERGKELDNARKELNELSLEILELSFQALALGQRVPAYDNRCPFPGLKAFQTEEKEFFFGRNEKVEKLTARVIEERFLAVLGNSGSGKSSLVLAGLVPSLKTWAQQQGRKLDDRHFTPGAEPCAALARIIEKPTPGGALTLLIADQFEELFTECNDLKERGRFVDALIAKWTNNPELQLVLTMRTDFVGDCLPYTALRELIQAHVEFLAPMTPEELGEAMEAQAKSVELRFEAGLRDTILDKLAHEPGAMPLLQHLLRELWKQRHGRWLRAVAYRAIGGVEKAIGNTADEIYAEFGRKNPKTKALMRDLFVRLTRLDESQNDPDHPRDTRRRVPITELVPVGTEPEEIRVLVARLADARLVVTSPDTSDPDSDESLVEVVRDESLVEVAHEALILHWPRLRTWLDADREGWILLGAVRQQASGWAANGEREVDLPRWGERLQQADALFRQARFTPTELERRFLVSAKALDEREREERKEQQRQRVEALEKAADEQRKKARNAWIGAAVATVLLALVVLFFLEAKRETARAQENEREALYQTATVYWNSGLDDHERHPIRAALFLATAAERFAELHSLGESANAKLALKCLMHRPVLGILLEHVDEVDAAFNADGTRVLTWSADGTARVWDAYTGEPVTAAMTHKDRVLGAKFTADGTRVLTWSADGTARVWDTHTGEPVTAAMTHKDRVLGAKFTADGTRVLTWSRDGTARVWDAHTGEPVTSAMTHKDSVWGSMFSPDRTRVLFWSKDGTARVWDARSGEPVTFLMTHEYEGAMVVGAAFNADGTRVLTWSRDDTARVWDAYTGEPVTAAMTHKDAVLGAIFNADGTRVLTWSEDRTARVWDASSGEPVTAAMTHKDRVRGANVNADGTRVLTWSRVDGTARVWDTHTGEPVTAAMTHKDAVSGAKFNADGTRVLTWSRDDTARVWDAYTGEPVTAAMMHKDSVLGAVFNADGTRVLTWSEDRTARVWDASSGELVTAAMTHKDQVMGAAFNADGTRVLTWSRDGMVGVWDLRSDEPVTFLMTHEYERAIWMGAAFNADGTRVLSWSGIGTARVWDAYTGEPVTAAMKQGSSLWKPEFSADGTRVLTWSADGTARVWDAYTGEPVTAAMTHKDAVSGAVFNADGTRVLTWSEDRTARVWDARSGEPVTAAMKHERPVMGAAFNGDATRVLTWSYDGTARVWDARSGEPVTAAMTHKEAVSGAVFNADGTRVLTRSRDGTARVWDARSGEPVTAAMKHERRVMGAAFNGDGTRVLTWSRYGTARVWDAQSGEPLTSPLKHEHSVSGAVFNADGTRVLTWSAADAAWISDSRSGEPAWDIVDQAARVWDASSGEPVTAAMKQGSSPWKPEFSADGTRVLTWSADGTARVWDAYTGEPVTAAMTHKDAVSGAVFNADGTRVLTWSKDGTARLWDARSGEPLTSAMKHEGLVVGAWFNADGTRVLTLSKDGTARVWDIAIDTVWPHDEIVLRTEVETGSQLTTAGQLRITTVAEWNRKKWCEYEPIRRQLGRIDDHQWEDAQRLCKQFSTPPAAKAGGKDG